MKSRTINRYKTNGLIFHLTKIRFRRGSNPWPFACKANVITTTLRNRWTVAWNRYWVIKMHVIINFLPQSGPYGAALKSLSFPYWQKVSKKKFKNQTIGHIDQIWSTYRVKFRTLLFLLISQKKYILPFAKKICLSMTRDDLKWPKWTHLHAKLNSFSGWEKWTNY